MNLVVISSTADLGPEIAGALGVERTAIRVLPSLELAAKTSVRSSWVILHAHRADERLLGAIRSAKQAGFHKVGILVHERDGLWEEKAQQEGSLCCFEYPLNSKHWKAVVADAEKQAPEERPYPAPQSETQDAGRVAAMFEYAHLLKDVAAGKGVVPFLDRLRRNLGAARCLLFLREGDSPWLTCAYHSGVSTELASNVRLGMSDGLGAAILRTGGVIQKRSAGGTAREEMELLGVAHAIPVQDTESLRGILLLGHQITGETLSAETLRFVYFLSEELAGALALRQLFLVVGKERELLTSLLDTGEAIVAFDGSLSLRFCNRKAKEMLFPWSEPGLQSLPKEIVSAIRESLEGRPVSSAVRQCDAGLYSLHLLDGPVVVAKVWSSDEVRSDADGAGDTKLLLRRMGRQLSNELRNSLTSIATLAQLAAIKGTSREDISQMGIVSQRDVKRLGRLSENLFLLSRSRLSIGDNLPAESLVNSSWERALEYTENPVTLSVTGDGQEARVPCEATALVAALSELFLNAAHAAEKGTIECAIRRQEDRVFLRISGPGAWTDEDKVGEPFFSSKAVGVGLGLTVAKKVVGDHGGTLTVHRKSGVEVELPIDLD